MVNVNSANCSAAGVNLGNPITNDNCGLQPPTNDAPSVYPLGLTTVTWTVKDINGNTATTTQTVKVATTLSANLSAGFIACNGSTTALTVSAAGGAAPYRYSLNGVGNYQSSNIFTVPAVIYTVKVKDAHGCTKTTGSKPSGSFPLSQPPPTQAKLIVMEVLPL